MVTRSESDEMYELSGKEALIWLEKVVVTKNSIRAIGGGLPTVQFITTAVFLTIQSTLPWVNHSDSLKP